MPPATMLRTCCALLCLLVACGSQPNFTIPVCQSLHRSCACQIEGWLICDRVCVDPKNDPHHCGGCGRTCDGDGVCVDGTCQDACGARERCEDRCRSDDDPWNCGACGTVCEGACALGTCGSTAAECARTGLTACRGQCANLFFDPQNCGACGVSCGGQPCGFRRCCLPSEVLCNGLCADLRSDPNNCGECGHPCFRCRDGRCI